MFRLRDVNDFPIRPNKIAGLNPVSPVAFGGALI
jgi:hypothetical protein